MQNFTCQIENKPDSQLQVLAHNATAAVQQYCDWVHPPDGAIITCTDATGNTTSHGVTQVVTYKVSEV